MIAERYYTNSVKGGSDNNFSGRTRFERLLLIGTNSTHLSLEALKAAIAEAKQGTDIGHYESAITALREIAPDDPDAKPDLEWLDKTAKQIKAQTDHLEQELKGYKNNLIKESIRVSNLSICMRYQLT